MTDSTIVNSEIAPESNLSEKKILIVDDDQLTVDTVAVFLQMAGYTDIRHETDSRLAIKAISDYKPDLVLLDIFMPHICGLELLTQIKSNAEFDKVIILMLSSAGQKEKYKSLELGAMGFVEKPVTQTKLTDAIATTFRVARRLGMLD